MISKTQALAIVAAHSIDANEFFAEMGNHETYNAKAVLYWLGY